MKKLSMLCAILFFFCAGSAIAQPTYQFAEAGTKNFVIEMTAAVGDQISLDLWLTDAGAPQNAGGAWIDFSASTARISYVSAGRAFQDGSEGVTGPWSPGVGSIINEPLGAGTLLYQVANLGGAAPDGDGDLIVGTLTLKCTAAGNVTVLLDVSDLIAIWTPINDANVVPASLLIHQESPPCISDDACDDGLFCTGVETCVGGYCQDGLDPDCDDGVGCTDDSCDEENDLCISYPNDGNCDDDDFCNGVETCDAVADCQAGTNPCPDDGLFCTGVESCLGPPFNRCVSGDNPCVPSDVCDEDTDTCDFDGDKDEDGIPDDRDNCPNQPNGPYKGTCTKGTISEPCTIPGYNTSQCGVCGFCDMGQINNDSDEWGDACDNCPFLTTLNQDDVDNDGVGDVCDNCLVDANQNQTDLDGDCVGNPCDEFPTIYDTSQPDTDGDGLGDPCDPYPYVPAMLPVADGHYFHEWGMVCSGIVGCFYPEDLGISGSIKVGYEYETGHRFIRHDRKVGILEFDLSRIKGLYTNDQIQAHLLLTVACGDLIDDRCLSLYSLQDENENGVVEEADIDAGAFIGEVCEELQPGATITFDVTSALEHDLLDPDQTNFSGFVIDRRTEWEDSIEFYDHTDPVNGPRLRVGGIDSDGDGIPDKEDSCPESVLVTTVIIDGCESDVENVLVNNGCKMTDLIYECADIAETHGKFVSCVTHLTNDWKKHGLISESEKGAIQNCAAKSNGG